MSPLAAGIQQELEEAVSLLRALGGNSLLYTGGDSKQGNRPHSAHSFLYPPKAILSQGLPPAALALILY